MKISVIVGLNFGDEGKGATVNSLISDPNNTLVVRFNGGHQVGHTVVHNNIRHPFSNFGSGTLKGVSTYWSEFCTVNPMAVKKEGDALKRHGITPQIVFNCNAMITTPYDIYNNLKDNQNLNHGSVGVGFGKTIQRNEDNYRLYVRDLFYPSVRDEKLKLIESYYGYDSLVKQWVNKVLDDFKNSCDYLIENYQMVNDLNFHNYDDYIFEGGQGILLDMNYGFFPNVTRSNTTSKNAMSLINRIKGNSSPFINTYYVTRAYQTRHGNGFMTNEDKDNTFIVRNPNETNADIGYQGVFRRTMLDFDLLSYAISCDKYHNKSNSYKLVITCLDQVPGKFPITIGNEIFHQTPESLGLSLGFSQKNILTSFSDKGVVKFE